MARIIIDVKREAVNLPAGEFEMVKARFTLVGREKTQEGTYKDTDEMLKHLRRLVQARLE